MVRAFARRPRRQPLFEGDAVLIPVLGAVCIALAAADVFLGFPGLEIIGAAIVVAAIYGIWRLFPWWP